MIIGAFQQDGIGEKITQLQIDAYRGYNVSYMGRYATAHYV
jgi:hypothetical protein